MEKSKFNCALIFRWVAIFMSLYHWVRAFSAFPPPNCTERFI